MYMEFCLFEPCFVGKARFHLFFLVRRYDNVDLVSRGT